ncbi:tRNA(Ile)-lysidine synthase [Nitratiruptor sp. YY09-18]|nr:tRNA(Ile)-lysidine synthase [Nitratiruptor sp. YY09-18]
MELLELERLQKGKNLLAFSGGVDSTALFFLLIEKNISFDIAIVNYKLRPQSDEEVAYAKELATRYNKRIFIKEVPLSPPSIEEKARKIRYRFFEEIIQKYGYENLLTAHQLNDQLEWFLMQLAKGAGVVEAIGLEPASQREGYVVVRPLLHTSKEEILRFLEKKDILYYIDNSNYDTSFVRNFIRKNFSDPLMQKFAPGIKRSMDYLLHDKKLLEPKIASIKKLFIAKNPHEKMQTQRAFLMMAKRAGYLPSTKQLAIMSEQKSGVIGGKIAFGQNERNLFVAPFMKQSIPKKMREAMRRKKIPPTIRGYIYSENLIDTLDRVLEKNLS